MANLVLVASLDVRTWVLIATSCRRLAWRNWGEGISWAQALTLFLQLPQFSLRQNGFELCCTLNFQGGWHHQCLPSQVSITWLSPGFFGGSTVPNIAQAWLGSLWVCPHSLQGSGPSGVGRTLRLCSIIWWHPYSAVGKPLVYIIYI
jgi:hypothetical protein